LFFTTGIGLSFPQGLIHFKDLSIGGCTTCAAFGTSEKMGLGCFVGGTAVGAKELTLLGELQGVCLKQVVPESAAVANPVLSGPVSVDVSLYH